MTTILGLMAALSLGPAAQRPLPFVESLLRPNHRFIVCCHRGDHEVAPENSLDAYERAAGDDADYGETDLRMTKDGVVVLMHDATVDRTTNGHGKVADLSFEEIRALKFKNAQRDGEKVPTFDELLDVAKGKLKIYMDIKAVRAKDVLPILRRHGMERDVIAYLYTPDQRDEWRRDAPNIPIISDNPMKSADQIAKDWAPHPFAISDGGSEDYNESFVAKFHELQVAVVPDIQGSDESPNKWKPLIDMGVDGLQTDHPKALIAYLKSIGLR